LNINLPIPSFHSHCSCTYFSALKTDLNMAFVTGIPVPLRATSFATKPIGAGISACPMKCVRRSRVSMSGSKPGIGNVPASPTPAPVAPPSYQLSPQELWQKIIRMGTEKGQMSVRKMFVLSIVGALYLSMGTMMSVQVGLSVPALKATDPGLQKLLFAMIGIPSGLILLLSVGGELFTANTSIVPAAYLKGKITFWQMFKALFVSYIGNIVGTAIFISGLGAAGMIRNNPSPGIAALAQFGLMKTDMSFLQAMIRGMFCNWLVCMASWLQAGAHDFINKFLAVLVPISAFIVIGFEHSVANMTFIPLAILSGNSQITWMDFIVKNLIPVTVGNLLGGAVLMTGLFFVAHDTGNKQ